MMKFVLLVLVGFLCSSCYGASMLYELQHSNLICSGPATRETLIGVLDACEIFGNSSLKLSRESNSIQRCDYNDTTCTSLTEGSCDSFSLNTCIRNNEENNSISYILTTGPDPTPDTTSSSSSLSFSLSFTFSALVVPLLSLSLFWL